MERKTKVHAEDGQHDLLITREFDLPVDLLFRAHADPEIFEEWMTHEYGKVKVLKYETKKHGSWQFQTSDVQGNVVFTANGVFQEFIPGKKITRTFEMENTGMDAQLEFLEFEALGEDTSRLSMHLVFRTVAQRDRLLSQPFARGLSMSHDRLQKTLNKLK